MYAKCDPLYLLWQTWLCSKAWLVHISANEQMFYIFLVSHDPPIMHWTGTEKEMCLVDPFEKMLNSFQCIGPFETTLSLHLIPFL